MNTKKSKKIEKFLTVFFIFVILAAVGLVFAFWPPVAYFNKDFYWTATTEELDLCGSPSDWPMYYLQFFGRLKVLHLYEPKEDDLKYIPDTQTLKNVSVSFAEIKAPSAVKAFGNIEDLHFLGSKVNFDGFGSETIKYLSFQSCGIYNFGKHGNFHALEEIRMYNCFFDKEDFSFVQTYDRTERQTLTDTTGFAVLDTVKKIYFDRVIIEDISGFINMRSLQDIKVDSIDKTFSADELEKLKEAGITVSEFDTEEQQ